MSKTPIHFDASKDVLRILEKNERQNDTFHSAPPYAQELAILKTKFVNVLNAYKNREKMLVDRCNYLESLVSSSDAPKQGSNEQ